MAKSAFKRQLFSLFTLKIKRFLNKGVARAG